MGVVSTYNSTLNNLAIKSCTRALLTYHHILDRSSKVVRGASGGHRQSHQTPGETNSSVHYCLNVYWYYVSINRYRCLVDEKSEDKTKKGYVNGQGGK